MSHCVLTVFCTFMIHEAPFQAALCGGTHAWEQISPPHTHSTAPDPVLCTSDSSDRRDQRAVELNSKPWNPLDSQWQHTGRTAFSFASLSHSIWRLNSCFPCSFSCFINECSPSRLVWNLLLCLYWQDQSQMVGSIVGLQQPQGCFIYQ